MNKQIILFTIVTLSLTAGFFNGPNKVYAQNTDDNKNSVYIEILGNTTIGISVNYERKLLLDESGKFALHLRSGVGISLLSGVEYSPTTPNYLFPITATIS
jgi:hypothetical protein